MKNFNNSWRNFLNESSRTENVPFEDTRIQIKLENKKNLLYEVTEDEFAHIEAAIEKMADLNELAFNDIFGDKTRMVIDFPTIDISTPLGRFVAMWKEMGYEVDWTKGMLSSERLFRDTSPSAITADLMGTAGADRVKPKKITMKIGKWLSKMLSYILKYNAMREKVVEQAGTDRYTGNDINAALGEDGAKNYYRLSDTIDMMLALPGGGRNATPEYIKALRKPEKLEELSRYWRDNAADIKKNLDKAQSNEYSIIITRNPIDVWRMSDFRNIESCHSPPSRGGGGAYYKCAVAEAHGHGAVAYAVDTDQLLQATNTETIEEAENMLNQFSEIFFDEERTWGGPEIELQPDMRVRLRQVRFDEPDSEGGHSTGVQLAVPERRTYGAKIPGFTERIVQWARETQKSKMEQAPRTEDGKLDLYKFTKFGGSSDDNPASFLLGILFGNTINGTSGYVSIDTETEDELDDEMLYSGIIESYQREVDNYKEHWNDRMRHVVVDGDAIDDGGGGVYITCGATLFIHWEADEWTRMPNAETISYVLSELKEFGFGWVVDHPAWNIQKEMSGRNWTLRVVVAPERLVGFHAQEFAYTPEDFEEFCIIVDTEVDDRADSVKSILETFFKREGYMEGGALMSLGFEIMNGDTGLYNWEAEAEEGYEPDEFELVIFTAHPEVWYGELNATEEQANQIMQDRNFWIEIRRRMAAPAFENTGNQMYPSMPLDMDMFGIHGTEGESQELNLYFSATEDDPDEVVEVLKELVNIWDDQDEINRVATEVFLDMLQGRIALAGVSVGDINEEKRLLDAERVLNYLNEIEDMQPATEEAAEADLNKWLAANDINRSNVDIEDADLNPAGADSAAVADFAEQAEKLGSVDQSVIDQLCKEGIKKRVLIAKEIAGDKIVDGKHRFIAAHKCKIALPATYISRKPD